MILRTHMPEESYPPRYVLRPLVADDAEQLGPLHVRIWRETYAGLMADEALAGLDAQQRTEMWRSWLASGTAPACLGAFAGDELVGWITVGPPRDDDAPVQRELWVLNVASEHQGSGIAQQMLDVALGDDSAYLWVVEGNARAIRFYEKNGFVLDGATQQQDEGNQDLRMVR